VPNQETGRLITPYFGPTTGNSFTPDPPEKLDFKAA
jgi:hypothetical protein